MWINHKHAFLCAKTHSKIELIEARRRLFLRKFRFCVCLCVCGIGGMNGWLGGHSVKEGRQNPKERKGEDFSRWWTEGGREAWGLGQRKAAGAGNASHCNDDVFWEKSQPTQYGIWIFITTHYNFLIKAGLGGLGSRQAGFMHVHPPSNHKLPPATNIPQLLTRWDRVVLEIQTAFSPTTMYAR